MASQVENKSVRDEFTTYATPINCSNDRIAEKQNSNKYRNLSKLYYVPRHNPHPKRVGHFVGLNLSPVCYVENFFPPPFDYALEARPQKLPTNRTEQLNSNGKLQSFSSPNFAYHGTSQIAKKDDKLNYSNNAELRQSLRDMRGFEKFTKYKEDLQGNRGRTRYVDERSQSMYSNGGNRNIVGRGSSFNMRSRSGAITTVQKPQTSIDWQDELKFMTRAANMSQMSAREKSPSSENYDLSPQRMWSLTYKQPRHVSGDTRAAKNHLDTLKKSLSSFYQPRITMENVEQCDADVFEMIRRVLQTTPEGARSWLSHASESERNTMLTVVQSALSLRDDYLERGFKRETLPRLNRAHSKSRQMPRLS